jgi:radical SAM superfamily enzyme YgiQ (UPF0313 family)
VCRGEGEAAISELAAAMQDRPEAIRHISNIWSKNSDGEVRKTGVRPFVEDLSRLPLPDIDIYAKYGYITAYSREMYTTMTGRGCPYDCSYCFNKMYKQLYQNKGKYLRKRTPEHVVAELAWARQEYGVKRINFVDDCFLSFPSWLREFSVLYRDKIRLPFVINVEAKAVKDELCKTLKEMGCICIRMGVETGNDHLRQEVLNKKVSGEQIRTAAGHIKRHGIKLTTYNILGLPGETLDNAMETYRLNRRMRADFAWCSLLQPYPGTAINEYVRKEGLFEEAHAECSLSESFFASTRVKLANRKEIVNLQKLMQVFMMLRTPPSLIRRLVKLPENAVYRLLFKLSFVLAKIRTQKIGLLPLIRLGLHSLSYMRTNRSGSPNS